jgi:hypothetical protein
MRAAIAAGVIVHHHEAMWWRRRGKREELKDARARTEEHASTRMTATSDRTNRPHGQTAPDEVNKLRARLTTEGIGWKH